MGAPTDLVRASANGVRFGVRAKLRAPKSAVVGVREAEILVAVRAAPVEGAANAEITGTIAAALGVPKANVEIVAGATSKSKVIEVSGLSLEEVRARLGVKERG